LGAGPRRLRRGQIFTIELEQSPQRRGVQRRLPTVAAELRQGRVQDSIDQTLRVLGDEPVVFVGRRGQELVDRTLVLLVAEAMDLSAKAPDQVA